MVSKQLRLDVAQLTDVGRKREHNEDNMAYVIPKDMQVMARKGALFIVADGMGGHAAGEVASEIAVDTISNVYYQDDNDDVATSLLHAIKRANALIHQRAAENMLRSGMGTTCVAAVLRGNMAYIANVGDSRAYLVRGSQVKQISQDHSWVGEQVRAGLLTEEQARTHAQRNVITRSLGTQPDVEIDIFSEPLQEGDSMVLCTDGLSGLVSDEEIHRIVDQSRPQESVYHLVERANENGGPDNITAIVILVQEVGVEPPGVRRPAYVGGRESSEDMTTLGAPVNGAAASSTMYGDGRTPSSPLRLSSGPLPPEAIDTIPQPITQTSPHRRSRLFYPTLALVVLVIMAMVATVTYFYLSKDNSAHITQNLQRAQVDITTAKGEVAHNPGKALQDYASAQSILRSVQQNGSLTSDQQKQLSQLQSALTTGVRTAVSTYNTNSVITSLPCNTSTTPPSHEISDGTTSTHAKSLALVQQNGKNLLYALGLDNKLYQISNNSLIPQNSALSKANIVAIAGTDSHLFVLTSQTDSKNTTSYRLNVLSAGQTTFDPTSVSIDSKFVTDGQMPTLLTAFGPDVYVLFTSRSAQTSAFLLDYTSSGNKPLAVAAKATFSVSQVIVSMAAFPGHQVFLLQAGGPVESIQVSNGNQVATSVLVTDPINPPLPVNAQTFTLQTPVPTATSGGFTSLSLPGTTSSSALAVGVPAPGTQPHLYIMDATFHRVLDLKMADTGTAGGVTPPVATATTTSTNSGGGIISSPPSKLQLVKQYASSSLFAQMRSMTVDSPGAQVNVLTQNPSSTMSLTSFSVSQQNGC